MAWLWEEQPQDALLAALVNRWLLFAHTWGGHPGWQYTAASASAPASLRWDAGPRAREVARALTHSKAGLAGAQQRPAGDHQVLLD